LTGKVGEHFQAAISFLKVNCNMSYEKTA